MKRHQLSKPTTRKEASSGPAKIGALLASTHQPSEKFVLLHLNPIKNGLKNSKTSAKLKSTIEKKNRIEHS